jgi:hypothetical protein
MSIISSLPVDTAAILCYETNVHDLLDPDAFEGALSDFQLSDKHGARCNERA